MFHSDTLTVRPYELDSYNHVNNAVYLSYLEHARMQFLNAAGFDFKGVTEAGFSLYVTHIDIRYKFSAFLNDELTIETYPVKTGKVSGTFAQKITKADGTVCVEATVEWACVNKQGRPSKLPEEFIVQGIYPDATAAV